MENIRLGFLASMTLCLISFPLFFILADYDRILDWIELTYLLFIFGSMFFAYMFLIMEERWKTIKVRLNLI